MPDGTDAQRPDQRAVHVARLLTKVINGGHQDAGQFGKAGAFGGQAEAAASALAQAKAQPAFQIGKLNADGRRADVQGVLGHCQSASIDDSQKDPQVAKIEVAEVAEHDSFLFSPKNEASTPIGCVRISWASARWRNLFSGQSISRDAVQS